MAHNSPQKALAYTSAFLLAPTLRIGEILHFPLAML